MAKIPAGAISDASGRPLAADDDLSFPAPPHQVVGRYVFYNGSYFDGGAPAPNSRDFSAVALDKGALLPGQTARFANYTSYDRGINGLMIDIQGLLNASAISASDFTFRVGNNSNPSTWVAAPAPSRIVVLGGAGFGGADRIEILWPDRAIANEWLQVAMLSDANTGLTHPDVFYFGNAIGESGNSATDAFVDGSDVAAARDNPANFLKRADVYSRYDYNRDSFVDGTDMAIARDHATNFLTALKLITVPAQVGAPAPTLAPTPVPVPSPAGTTGSGNPPSVSSSASLTLGTSTTNSVLNAGPMHKHHTHRPTFVSSSHRMGFARVHRVRRPAPFSNTRIPKRDSHAMVLDMALQAQTLAIFPHR